VKRPSASALAAALVLLVLASIAVVTAPPQVAATPSYISTDYGGGGYRAWAALLHREGLTTTAFRLRPIELDARIDTLISAQSPFGTDAARRTEADLAALAAWVRSGGRLVYLGRALGLTALEDRLLLVPFWLPDVGARPKLSGPLAPAVGALANVGPDRMLLVEHTGQAELSDGNGEIVARYPLGRGEVVAVADPEPFANDRIAAAGNARLAYLIGVPRRPGGLVAFDDGVHGGVIDRPWYRALPLPLRVGLGLLGVAALLGLIGSALRGGPAVRLRRAREPTSAEFVAAIAALYERNAQRAGTARLLIRDALRAAARANGLPDGTPPSVIAERISLPAAGADVRRLAALEDAPVTTDAALIASAALAHTVRKEWKHGGIGDGRRAAFTGRSRTGRRRE
jgi:hypothetical protein